MGLEKENLQKMKVNMLGAGKEPSHTVGGNVS
jgi:hypothetical protein